MTQLMAHYVKALLIDHPTPSRENNPRISGTSRLIS
jgi:hypothetical protein